jgi:hypothetical protein
MCLVSLWEREKAWGEDAGLREKGEIVFSREVSCVSCAVLEMAVVTYLRTFRERE